MPRIVDPTTKANELLRDEIERVFFAESVVYVTPLTMGKAIVVDTGLGPEFRHLFFCFVGLGDNVNNMMHWTGLEFGCEVVGMETLLVASVKKGAAYAFDHCTKQRQNAQRQALTNGKVAATDEDLKKFGNVPILGQKRPVKDDPQA